MRNSYNNVIRKKDREVVAASVENKWYFEECTKWEIIITHCLIFVNGLFCLWHFWAILKCTSSGKRNLINDMEAKNWHLMIRTINSLDLAWVFPLGFSFSKCKTYGDYIGIRFNQQSRRLNDYLFNLKLHTMQQFNFVCWCSHRDLWLELACSQISNDGILLLSIFDTSKLLFNPNCISSRSNNGLVLIGGLFVHTCAMCSIKYNA